MQQAHTCIELPPSVFNIRAITNIGFPFPSYISKEVAMLVVFETADESSLDKLKLRIVCTDK